MAGEIKTNLKWNGEVYCEAGFDNVSPIKVAGKSALEDVKNAWSPVHMLLAAVETCFMVTFMAIAEKARLKVVSYESSAIGEMSAPDGKHYEISKVTLIPKVKLENSADEARLKTLFEKAEEHCVVANTLKIKSVIQA